MLLQFSKLKNWEYAPLCFLIAMVLILQFSSIMLPNEAAFDESYYLDSARQVLNNDLTLPEHPPLGQFIIAFGISLFGDNPLGWRFFSVIFGIASLIVFYLTCRQLKLSPYTSFMAVSLLSLDGLFLWLSRLAMLDVFSLTFVFLAFWFYLTGRYYISGLSIGLATLCKLTGGLALLCLMLFWLFSDRKQIQRIAIPVIISIVSFMILLPVIDLMVLHTFTNPIVQISQLIGLTTSSYHEANTVTNITLPWQWIFSLNGFHGEVKFDPTTNKLYYFYNMIINPAIWALIVPGVGCMVYLAIKRNQTALFALCWFAATYLFWIPFISITGRQSYDFYFYPTIGAIIIGISLAITQIMSLRNRLIKLIVPVYMGIVLLLMVQFYPHDPIFLWAWAIVMFLFLLIYSYTDKYNLKEVCHGK